MGTQEFNGYFNAAAGGNSDDSCSSFSLPSCNQVGRFLVDLGNLLKNSYCSECSNQQQTTTTTPTTGTPCCMRLDIVVRNSQDDQPIPGAAMNVYYQHVNGLKTVARNMTVGANGTASIEVRAENDGLRSFHKYGEG